ncbi:hypothetical protein BC831DRAFT_553920 [Entophlyctis helioformis]|nr:hypothetical protein BC831DRAFT_553920 [Entophlyctis helioformis]
MSAKDKLAAVRKGSYGLGEASRKQHQQQALPTTPPVAVRLQDPRNAPPVAVRLLDPRESADGLATTPRPTRRRQRWAFYTFDGDEHSFKLTKQQTVLALKEHIAKEHKVVKTSLTVLLDGELLADDDTIVSDRVYDVERATTILDEITRLLLKGSLIIKAKEQAMIVFARQRAKREAATSSDVVRLLAAIRSETVARRMFSLSRFGIIYVAAFKQFGHLDLSSRMFDNPVMFVSIGEPPSRTAVHGADDIAADESQNALENKIGDLAVGAPLPVSITSRLDAHAQTHQAAAWRRAMLTLNSFWHKMEAAPEAGYHIMYHTIFKAALESLDPLVGVSAEDQLSNYNKQFDRRRSDIAACIKNPPRRTNDDRTATQLASLRCPFFLAEVSGFRVTGTDDHKDFQKIACDMMMCMLVWLGLFRGASVDMKKELRVYGALIGASTIEFICMRPVFETGGQVVLLLHTNKSDWTISFDTQAQGPAAASASAAAAPPSEESSASATDPSDIDEEVLAASAAVDERLLEDIASQDDQGQVPTDKRLMGFVRADLSTDEGHTHVAGHVG